MPVTRAYPPADLAPLLPQLADTGIEYVSVHKISSVYDSSIPVWREAQTQSPLFEDGAVAVYPISEANASFTDEPQLLESCIAVQSLQGTTVQVKPGDVWNIELHWSAGNLLRSGYKVELALTDLDGQSVTTHQFDIGASKPTNEWERWEKYEASYEFPLDFVAHPRPLLVASHGHPPRLERRGIVDGPVDRGSSDRVLMNFPSAGTNHVLARPKAHKLDGYLVTPGTGMMTGVISRFLDRMLF